MAEYIDREALYENAYWHGEHPDVDNPFPDGVDAIDIKDVDAIPAADVVPVVHGRWIRPHWKNDNYCCNCSECGGEAMHIDYQWNKNNIYPICPNCGAKMDGGADH